MIENAKTETRRSGARAVLLAMTLAACSKESATNETTTAPSTSVAPSSSDATVSTDAPAETGVDATVDATPEDAQAPAVPPLNEQDGAPLPQTDAFPSLDSGSFHTRINLLWDAIVRDDAQRAGASFFPLVAYQQVKAIPNPAADYNARLLRAFARDVHAYHQKLGSDPAAARLVRIDVPTAKAKWMEPGSEGNKLGYDRVLDSTLVYVDADGKERTLAVKSMISWRGEWYVVHLAGFK